MYLMKSIKEKKKKARNKVGILITKILIEN